MNGSYTTIYFRTPKQRCQLNDKVQVHYEHDFMFKDLQKVI